MLAGLILCSHSAFADDENISNLPPEIAGSILDPAISIDADADRFLREESKAIAEEIFGTNDLRATDYTELIYNYLYNNIAPNQVAIYQQLGGNNSTNIYTLIKNGFQYLTRVLYGSTSVPSSLTNSISIWKCVTDLQSAICYGSFTTSSGSTLYSPISKLVDIANSLQTATGTTTAISELISISSNIGGLYTVQTTTNTKLDTLHTDNSSIITSVQSIYDQFNTNNWVDISSYYTFNGISSSIDGTYSIPTSNTSYSNDIYISVTGSSAYYNSSCIRIDVPFSGSSSKQPKLEFYYPTTSGLYTILDVEYFYSAQNIYLLGFPIERIQNFIIRFYDLNSISYRTNISFGVYRSNIITNQLSFIRYTGYEINHKLSSLSKDINQLTNVIASDDIIQAKENSTPVIDEALNDFTGSGSASAGVSDISGAKNVSSSLKSGLNSGGSISDSLTVFSPANAFWGWFSQDNANYFTPYSQSRYINP